jgi:hypothetical protein
MKNFKKTHIYVFVLLFLGLECICAKKDKSLPLNEEYADNKFVDAEANYRVSNSKPQIEQLHLTT